MIASVHLADVGLLGALARARRSPTRDSVAGLRHADVGLAAPLRRSSRPSVQSRAALVAFWDDDAALDRFLEQHPLAARYASGWHVRLAPLRAYGAWPGLPSEVPAERNVPQEGPVAALTLAHVRPSQMIRFVRTSARAEASVFRAPGLTWATGIGRPPWFVATFSLWESTRALSAYAYGRSDQAHPDAIASSAAKPFHREQAFIRFRPYASHGSLEGRNALPQTWMAPV